MKLKFPEYVEDTKRIVNVVMNHGIWINPLEAEQMWEEYSDTLAATWMTLPEDDSELWDILKEFFIK